MAIITPTRHMALWIAFAYMNEERSTQTMLKRFPNREFVIPGLADWQALDGDKALRKLFDTSNNFQRFIDTRDTSADEDLCYAAAALACFADWLENNGGHQLC